MSRLAFAALFLCFALPAIAQEEAPAEEAAITGDDFVSGLNFQQGRIEIGDGLASLDVPETFRFLGPDDSKRVIEDLWGNPPRPAPLGMLFPADISPAANEGWGVIITYDEDGFVEDDEAAELDYDQMLADMREGTKEENAERKKMGYEEIELVGWAEPPHYDSASHKLYWAKDLRFGEAQFNTLNYNIRVLGRKGVLVLNAVAATSQLGQIRDDMNDVLVFTNFNDGHRYEDFNPELDKVAAYGIGALVAGKVAAKAGLLKGLIALLVAGKKFVVIGLIALGAFLKRLFTGKVGEETAG
jgi:uncharacterized membrane-anchored protein